jgi:hypothetical protein
MLVPGECYLIPDPETGRRHLFIVASWEDAHGRALLVNMTDERNIDDQSCLVRQGDHPFITKPTLINYADAKTATEAQLSKHVASGRIVLKERANGGLLRRVQVGAGNSQALDQGLHYFRKLMDNNPPDPEIIKELTPQGPKVKVVVKRPK